MMQSGRFRRPLTAAMPLLFGAAEPCGAAGPKSTDPAVGALSVARNCSTGCVRSWKMPVIAHVIAPDPVKAVRRAFVLLVQVCGRATPELTSHNAE